MYRTDRVGKGGGVAIYVKSKFISPVTKAKEFEILVVKVGVSKNSHITVVGCYRPPSASKEAFKSISDILHDLNDSKLILMGELNWDWLSWTSDCFKELCDSLNLVQLIHAPTRQNLKSENKSTLLELIITNAFHKYSSIGIFCNDVSDHCTIPVLEIQKFPRQSRVSSLKCNLKILTCRPS